VQWSPRPAETVVLCLVALALTVAVVFLDLPGRLLVGTAALVVLALAVRDVVARPRLSAGPDGVEVRSWASRRHLPWALLRVRVRATRRLGMTNRALELDTAAGPDDAGVLVLLGRRDLGADPEAVARALHALNPTRP
jgi:Bacterial PH domain